MASCVRTSTKTGNNKKVIVVQKEHHDNGQHKGWYKNPNNPHHPRTTNPGHTKKKGKAGAATVKNKKHKN
ncbi:hypothetical protein GCM10028895_24900 [Pontibacter rugosus]